MTGHRITESIGHTGRAARGRLERPATGGDGTHHPPMGRSEEGGGRRGGGLCWLRVPWSSRGHAVAGWEVVVHDRELTLYGPRMGHPLVKSYQMFPDESDADNKYRWWRKFSVALTRRLHQARMNVPPLVRDWATRTHQQVGKVRNLSNNTVVVSGSGFHRSKFVRARGPVKD